MLESETSKAQDNREMILLGDFNGRLGFLVPQSSDYNGNNVLNIIEKWNMILLNGNSKCEGEITRRQANVESTIDFVPVNQAMYKFFFEKMYIDEGKGEFDLSDHCLTEASFGLDIISKEGTKERILERNYLKTDCEILKEHLVFMRKDITDHKDRGNLLNMEELEKILRRNTDRTLRKERLKSLISVREEKSLG